MSNDVINADHIDPEQKININGQEISFSELLDEWNNARRGYNPPHSEDDLDKLFLIKKIMKDNEDELLRRVLSKMENFTLIK